MPGSILKHALASRAHWVLALVMLSTAPAHASSCMQASGSGEIAEGRLSLGQFEDAAGRPESALILTLPVPTCLAGDDEMDNVETAEIIHVFFSDDALAATLESYIGKDVQMRGTPFGSHTAHHHAPIVMDISEIDSL
jgi:Domain of unknown function (DUF4431)